MRQHTDDYLRLAHSLVQSKSPVEVVCIGTRLTRITNALKPRNPAVALYRASECVADWAGGTRIGPAVSEFLASQRMASFARGAVVIVLSDGLERGNPRVLIDEAAKLRRRCWRLVWATPLAADPRYRPVTAAMRDLLPHLSDLVDGSSLAILAGPLLRLEHGAPPASRVWTRKGENE